MTFDFTCHKDRLIQPADTQMEKATRKLFALRTLWDAKRSASNLPRRADFDPKSLRPWIGNLALVEIPAGGEPLFRICGTNLHDRFGGEFTGRAIGSLAPEIERDFRHGLTHVCRSKAPLEMNCGCTVNGEARSFRDAYLPLSDDDACIGTVLFASFEISGK
jgi:hypothetical protein